jgi:branched-chain amino acid transport system permease protein
MRARREEINEGDKAVEYTLITLLNGLSYGLLLFMLSSGLTLIFSMMGVLNFAHTSFYMLGAYFAYTISTWLGFWAGLVFAPLLVGGLGALVERFGLRAVHRHGHVAELLFTFGLAYIIVELVQLTWGRLTVSYAIPAEMDRPLFTLYATTFPMYRAFMMVVALLMLGAIYLLLTRTRMGLVIQAALSHPDSVEALGHNVPRVFMLVFGGGAALAGLAGVIGGNAFVTEPAMAATVGSIIFVVIVVGGLGSLVGALVASLIIGLIQTGAVTLDYSLLSVVNSLGGQVASDAPFYDLLKLSIAQVAPLLPFVLLVLVLVFRPKGLMGTRET